MRKRLNLPNKLWIGLGFITILLVFITNACKKEDTASSDSSRTVSAYLTDAPCDFDSVLIDIRYVEVKYDVSKEHKDDDKFGDKDEDGDDDNMHHDGFGKWDTLVIRAGVYNVTKLRNGVETLLGTVNIPIGKIRKMRITLGTNNTVVKAGVSHSLLLMPGKNNYVYIKIHGEDEDEDSATKTAIRLDFNICESIIEDNGQFFLRPHIRPFSHKHYGAIEGKVFPHAALPVVTAYNGTDTASTIPEEDGEYKIKGLREGTYRVVLRGAGDYKDTTLFDVKLKKGEETHLPTITLHK